MRISFSSREHQPISMCVLGHTCNILVITAASLFSSVFSAQTFRIEPQDATAIRGQTVLLRCEISDLVGEVTWMRDGFGLGQDRELSGYPRYRLEGSSDLGEFTLMLSNVQLEDDAMFQCQVLRTMTTPAMVSRTATVTVYLPPDDPVITGQPRVEVIAGEPYNLSCIAANGKPAASISWFSGAVPITDDTYYSVVNQSDNKRQTATSMLTITPKKADQDKRYYCEVSNEGTGGFPRDTSVALEVLYPPTVAMTVSPRHDRLKEGKSVTFTCDATANPSDVTWKWFRGPEELADRTSNVLVEKMDRDWHAAKVECEATNKVGSTRQGITLNVEYSPRFTAGAEHVAADIGDDAELNCAVDGNPSPTVIWMKRDSQKILSSNNKLTVYDVSEKDFGVYVCTASILGFSEIQMDVHLMKKGAPLILSDVEQKARYGDTGVVECMMRSVPKPTSIKWLKDGEPLIFADLDRYNNREEDLPNGKRSMVEITDVRTDDYGTYNCSVENGYGSDVISIKFSKQAAVAMVYIVAAVLIVVFIIIVVVVSVVIYRRKKSSHSSETDSDTSESSISKRKDGPPGFKVEYAHGSQSVVDAWHDDLYGKNFENDEPNYKVGKDPWGVPGYDYRDNYGSHYGGLGPGYARSDYGTYPGPQGRGLYDTGRYGSQNIYGGPAYSDYGIYGTYGRPPPPRSDYTPLPPPPEFLVNHAPQGDFPPRNDYMPASELGRPGTGMSSRLSTNV